MADSEGSEMSKQGFSVSYDGRGRADDHSMDVEALAPALLAMGRLIRTVTAEVNGKRSTAKVLVVSDFEHKCFNINFEVIITLLEQVKSLIGDDDVQSAKTILEWIGLIGGPPVVAGMSYLGYLKWKKGRPVSHVTEMKDQDSAGLVQVHIEGEHNHVEVHNHVYKLSENPAALKATRDTFAPIGKDGIDQFQVRAENGEITEEYDAAEVADILLSADAKQAQATAELLVESVESPVQAWLSVYGPVYDEHATLWRFRLGTDIIYADISETMIAADALERGGAGANDAYNVMLEVTPPETAGGRTHYKILEVMNFIQSPQPQQTSMKFDPDGN